MKKTRFEWDADKDAENQKKHRVPLSLAQYAFADPNRVIAEDLTHSKTEKRYFCFGEVNGVFSPSALPIGAVSFESLAPATGGKEKQFMSAKIKYTNEPIEARAIRDFLPPPEELAFREEGVKVTIALSKKSVEFFKAEASKHHTQYQRMIRKLIDTYVDTYAEPLTSRPTRTVRKR